MTKSRIVVVGGGYAGHKIAFAMQDQADVTLIDPKSFLEIPMAMPRQLVDPGSLPSLVRYSVFLPKVRRVQGRVVSVTNSSVHTDDGTEVGFDFLILSTGSNYQSDLVKPQGGNTDERMAHYRGLHAALLRSKSVLIVGGGPLGVEIAGEITQERTKTNVTLVEKSLSLLPWADPVLQRWAESDLRRRGAKLILGHSLVTPVVPAEDYDPEGGIATTDHGEEIRYDLALWCLGARPDARYLLGHFPDALDPAGQIKVAPNLLKTGSDTIFAIGDATDLADKGVLRINVQVKVVLANLRAGIEGRSPATFVMYKPSLHLQSAVISLGRKSGVMRLAYGRSRWGPLARMLKSGDMLVGQTRKAIGLHPTIQ
jgi:apoptosis-inducing factor 2